MTKDMTEVERAAHVAAYAIPALLSDGDLRFAWLEHWRQFDKWTSAGQWFDRHRQLLVEANHREIFLNRY